VGPRVQVDEQGLRLRKILQVDEWPKHYVDVFLGLRTSALFEQHVLVSPGEVRLVLHSDCWAGSSQNLTPLSDRLLAPSLPNQWFVSNHSVVEKLVIRADVLGESGGVRLRLCDHNRREGVRVMKFLQMLVQLCGVDTVKTG